MPHLPYIICIAGGIGTGKSTVSQILRSIGYKVYDCDKQAKALIDQDIYLRKLIADHISAEVLREDNSIDRARLAEIVFTNPKALECLNHITHSAVKADLSEWIRNLNEPLAFVETAIVYQSGVDRLVQAIWEIIAPMEIRIERLRQRNGWGIDHIMSRINTQSNYEVRSPHPDTQIIENNMYTPLLPRVFYLLNIYCKRIGIVPRCEPRPIPI